jgi:transposase-like protein
MATTKKPSLPELMAQIAELQAQAEKVKDREKTDVIARIRDAIEVYGITPSELFDRAGKAKRGAEVAKQAKATRRPKRRARRVFSDADKQRLVNEHAAHVATGLTFAAASDKIDVSDPLVRSWYVRFPPKAGRKAQAARKAAKKARPVKRKAAKKAAPAPAAAPQEQTGT